MPSAPLTAGWRCDGCRRTCSAASPACVMSKLPAITGGTCQLVLLRASTRLVAVTQVACLNNLICHAQQRLHSARKITPTFPSSQHTCVQPYVTLELHVCFRGVVDKIVCARHSATHTQRHVAVAAGHFYTVATYPHHSHSPHPNITVSIRRGSSQAHTVQHQLAGNGGHNCFALSVQFCWQVQFGTLKHEAEGAMFSAAQAHEQDVRKTG